jgi:predicted house-cleaning noncanonical NTP pyrophosphatase (MazG superfamily)
MKKIKYNKLIRDKIPEIIRRDNAVPKISYLNNKRFIVELKKKLLEEGSELQETNDKKSVLNELSDILEIIQSIAKTEKILWRNVEEKRKLKNKERGGFKKKIFLKEVRELN